MDAQNGAESSSTKHPASPKGGDDASKSKPAVVNSLRSPLANSPSLARDLLPTNPTAFSNALDEEAAADQSSDAETIVLPGKDGVSPSKPRKVIKHEDNSDENTTQVPRPRKPLKDRRDAVRNGGHSDDAPTSSIAKKKRSIENDGARAMDSSGGLSSAPNSPPAHQSTSRDPSHNRRKAGDSHSDSDSESSRSRSHKLSSKDKLHPPDRLLPSKRKAVKRESDDEGDVRRARRPRISESNIDVSSEIRERDHRLEFRRQPDKSSARNRSASPSARSHRRSLSTHFPSQSSNGLGQKKRRIPAPLTTDYQSDDSSASGSPHPRGSKLRTLATPITGDSTMSPAKIPGHKKRVDNHGQTLFAKACAKGEYGNAKARLSERPDDLNFADYAGNTPLQVAALNGHEDIVELLIEAGCDLECRNSDKETPLLDAVENGHLAVVKLLLKAGVNPRRADAEGHEPLEKVPDDVDNAEEIRAALREAKERVGELRRTSEDHPPQDAHETSSHGPDSPRRSPAAPYNSILAEKRRGGTVRSAKTSNHLLYVNLDDKTLRQAAARGDNETVTRVLQVKEQCDDPEALVNAARGGHNLVVELLLALGGANPDPEPVPTLAKDYGTPMLAAIGQENIEVVRLLLNANGFDPTRRYKGQTYYEIARRREGPNWKEEEHALKDAFDHYKRGAKGSFKVKASPRRGREVDIVPKRAARSETSPEVSRSQKRRSSVTPPRDMDAKRKQSSSKPIRSPREKRRSGSFGTHDEQTSPKRGPGRPKKDERTSNHVSSDREPSPPRSKLPTKPKLLEAETAGSSDGEAIKPRRKLISGKDLKGQREKQRRASMASNISGIERSDSKNEEPTEKSRADRISAKHHDRTKALKREESNDRHMTDRSGKRHRPSVSPSRHGSGDKEDGATSVKRRKLDAENKQKRHLEPRSPENRHSNRDPSRDSNKRIRTSENDRKDSTSAQKANRDRRESDKVDVSDRSIVVASEEQDINMQDVTDTFPEEGEIQAESDRDDKLQKKHPHYSHSTDENAKREKSKEAERKLQEQQKKEQEEESKRKEQEAEKKRLEAEERNRLAREELKRKEAAEKARLEEEQRQKEAQERKIQEEQARKEREELERKRREEEERVRREKEAAEEARRIQEEEERREKERKRAEQAAREAAREAELERARQVELERIRVSKLPPVLRWLNVCPNPKQKELAEHFTQVQGVRYDTIDLSAAGKPGGRDQWLLNTQVALLLGDKDHTLSRYAGWTRIPVPDIAKQAMWRLEQDRYSLIDSRLYTLGEQLGDLYGGDPRSMGYKQLEQIRDDAWKRFLETELFFVKESDFLCIVPSIAHLRDVQVAICYLEIPEGDSFTTLPKWRQDEDGTSFAPRNKYYINGQIAGEQTPQGYVASTKPVLQEYRVPRRYGLIAVTPNDPDYARLCIEQNLAHLLTEQQKQSVLNGSHLTPKSMVSDDTGDHSSPSSVSPRTHLVNGIVPNGELQERLPNGTHET